MPGKREKRTMRGVRRHQAASGGIRRHQAAVSTISKLVVISTVLASMMLAEQ